VMFICTANVLHTIPQALRDRMEVLQLAGYTEAEKIEIAKRFLAPKAVEGTGLTKDKITFTDEAIQTVINRYTREAGVRNLERAIDVRAARRSAGQQHARRRAHTRAGRPRSEGRAVGR